MGKAVVRALTLVVLAALVAGGASLWMQRPWRVVASVNGANLTSRELDLRVETYGGDRREMTRTWIAKEVLLGEAVQKNMVVATRDEREAKDVLASWLKAHGSSFDQFFAQGPMPEDAKRQDFKEGMLIHAFVKEGLGAASFPELYRPLREGADVRCPEFPELERIETGAPLYAWIWGWRPSLVAVCVDNGMLTVAELDLRVRAELDNLRRIGRPVSKESAPMVSSSLRRDGAKRWIQKVVMSNEAVRRGIVVTDEDEKRQMVRIEAPLKALRLTVGQFFKDGVLPESLKWADFRATIRINKLAEHEVGDKINVTTPEIESRMAELQRWANEETVRVGKPVTRADRKSAIDQIRKERYFRGYRALFRSLYATSRVWSPEFPEMERVDGVSAPSPDDQERK